MAGKWGKDPPSILRLLSSDGRRWCRSSRGSYGGVGGSGPWGGDDAGAGLVDKSGGAENDVVMW